MSAFLSNRLVSLDVYRGLIMVALAFRGFGLDQTAARHLKEEGSSPFWEAVKYQWSHVEWVGCGFWDLIQPSFMFMVGVAMAFSYLKRQQEGQSYLRMLGHAATRALVLILLGMFLISNNEPTTNWSLMNVLSQIGLGYVFLFLLWNRPAWLQGLVAAALLVGTWGLYMSYPTDGINLETGKPEFKISPRWARDNLTGLDPHWHKSANVGHAIDLVVLNWMPRQTPYVFNGGGYQTINFVPSLATMIFGLMAGELLRSGWSARRKLAILLVAGVTGLVVGQVLDQTGVCPLVKRIWTPSWALFSTGWCLLILAALYAVVDLAVWRAWTFPLVVVGVNSIAIYTMSMLLPRWAAGVWKTHFGSAVFDSWGPLWEPTLQALLVGLLFWLACWWMYRQKIFVRI